MTPTTHDMNGLSYMQAGPAIGSGSLTFIFIAGYGCNKEIWREVFARLSQRHTCIAVDMPGHGASSPQLTRTSIQGFGEIINELRVHLRLEKPVLAGHSMGGRIALETARQARDAFSGLVLVDVSRAVAPDRDPGYAPGRDLAARERQSGSEDHKAFRAHMRAMFEDNFSETCDPAIREEIRASSKALDRDTASALTPTIGKWDHEVCDEALQNLRCPLHVVQSTYLIYGRSRRILEPGDNTPYFDMIRKVHPDVEIDMIRTGHFAMLEEPEKMSEAMARFAARLEGERNASS